MLIAVEGCMHGELETVYKCLESAPRTPELLLCCGDFQGVRNRVDMNALAVPVKYRTLADFHLYYSGQKKAPILTIFVGGNHEASNYLQELPYGGWVAPNIYYLGYAGVVTVGGIRIGGVSGIYKGHDFLKGHHESPPYSEETKRSVYHYRNLEFFRLQQLSGDLDIFLSHDWPRDITSYGNVKALLKKKPFFESDISNGKLGSPPLQTFMERMEPKYWFAAHLHCRFPALFPHKNGDSYTRFLALDKCLPHRKFLQILEIPHDPNASMELRYDLEWLTILRLTNHLLSVRAAICHMPGKDSQERWNFVPTEEEKQHTLELFGDDLLVPQNFEMTSETSESEPTHVSHNNIPVLNPQNSTFCDKIQIDDPVSLILLQKGTVLQPFEKANVSLNDSCSQSNDTSSVSLDVSDSQLSATDSTSVSQLSISRLSLPEPTQNYEDKSDNDVSVNNTLDESTLSELDTTSHSETLSPTKKVFKRRNESLYKSNLED